MQNDCLFLGREFKVQTVTVELVELFLTHLDNSLEIKFQNGKLGIEEFRMFFFFKRKVIFFSFVQRVLNGRNLRDFREVLPIAWKKRKQRIIILSKGMMPYNKPLTLTLKLLTLLALDSTGEYQPYFITSFYYRPYFPASAWICHPYAQSVRNYYSFIFCRGPAHVQSDIYR